MSFKDVTLSKISASFLYTRSFYACGTLLRVFTLELSGLIVADSTGYLPGALGGDGREAGGVAGMLQGGKPEPGHQGIGLTYVSCIHTILLT